MPALTSEALWGVAGFVLGTFFGSFLSAAGASAWRSVAELAKEGLKSEHEVEPSFRSALYAEQNVDWIPEGNLKNKETHSWTYHPHPNRVGKCYRVSGEGKFLKKEYLMVTPNAQRLRPQ